MINVTDLGNKILALVLLGGVSIAVVSCGGGGDGDSSDAGNNIIDTVSPNPVLTTSAATTTNISPIPLSINFGESVTGLSLDEISVMNGVASNLLDLDGQNYTVAITPAAEGLVEVSLPASVAQDAAGNASLASNTLNVTYQTPSMIIYYQENFDSYADNNPWPEPWVIADSSPTVSATIQSGQACLEGLVLTGAMNPSGQDNLARIVNTALSVQDFEARFQLVYEDFQNQGAGFYGRQNGAFLDVGVNDPTGQGYGFFLKGFAVDQLSFWYEILGDEIPHHEVELDSVLDVVQGELEATTLNVVYQVEQISVTETRQRAKIWLAADPEPIDWQIVSDNVGTELPGTNPMAIPDLQNLSAGFAIDLYNSSNPSVGSPTTQSICLDNFVITGLQ